MASKRLGFRSRRGIDRSLISDLLTCGWVERQQNVLITGQTGAGKTWLACSLAVQAARHGIPVSYRRVGRLLEEMEIAHADGALSKVRAHLAKAKLLILDDFGLTPLNGRGRADLLELLDDRVGSGATIVAGQMPIQNWHAFIHGPALADAILDRLIHSSHKLELKGKSMRKRRTRAA